MTKMSKAYVETTILTNVLLKPGSAKETSANLALARYDETLLPVYSIKEWKNGPLDHYAFVHDKLVQTKSLAATITAMNAISAHYKPYKKSTSYEAFEAAAHGQITQSKSGQSSTNLDFEMSDRYRLALASLIIRSWRKRRKVTTKTIQDLECYIEASPRLGRDGYFDLKPQKCERDRRCCLWDRLRARPKILRALREAIPESSNRLEDQNRRKTLKQLINTPKIPITEEQCRWLGDAVFAFFCPDDAVVLTTNIKDHKPLAEAIGKTAEQP
jgi:hypothetical protein